MFLVFFFIKYICNDEIFNKMIINFVEVLENCYYGLTKVAILAH